MSQNDKPNGIGPLGWAALGMAVGVSVSTFFWATTGQPPLPQDPMDGLDDQVIQAPACAIIYRVDNDERVPVATIGYCNPSNSTVAV